MTAWLMLNASTHLRKGESVLVHGAAGGVGSIAVQLAKVMGAGLVIGSASSEEKRDFVRSLGANAAIDYSVPGWVDEVLRVTEGRGVDVILESIGGTSSSGTLRASRSLEDISSSALLAAPANPCHQGSSWQRRRQ